MNHFLNGFVDELTKLGGITPDFMTRQSYGPDYKALGMKPPPKIKQVSSGWTKDPYGDPRGSAADRQKAAPGRAPAPKPPPQTRALTRGTAPTRKGRALSNVMKM